MRGQSRGRPDVRKSWLCSVSVVLIAWATLAGFAGAEVAALTYAARAGASSDDRVQSVAFDATGQLYATGRFNGTVDFDPSTMTYNLSGPAFRDSLFVQKLDSLGDFVWARGMSGTASVRGTSLAVDSTGNVYVAGFFDGTADFDPSAGVVSRTSNGFLDIFILKLDSSGDLVWAKTLGSTDNDLANSIALDTAENLVITGSYIGTVDFDPGAGTLPLSSAGAEDVFILKLDSAGDLVWAKSVGGAGTSFLGDLGHGVCVDAFDAVYVAGAFEATADFDPGLGIANRTSAGGNDIFMLKLDALGGFVWAQAVGGTGQDLAQGIALSDQNSPCAVGSFRNTVDFNPDAGTWPLTAAGDDIFVWRLDTLGGFEWARAIGGTSNDLGIAIASGASGALHTTGFIRGVVDLDPGLGTNSVSSLGDRDVFVQKLSGAGDFLWGISFGGTGGDAGNALAVSGTGDVLVGGQFRDSVDFDPGAAEVVLDSLGGEDCFIAKFASLVTPSARDDSATTDEDSVLNVEQGGLVFMDRATGTIASIPREGGGVNTLLSAVARSEGIAVDMINDKIYWSVQAGGMIERASLNGSNREVFLSGLGGDLGGGLAIDPIGAEIFWTDTDGKRLRKANLDGSGVQDVLTGLGSPYGLAIDPVNDQLFFTEPVLGAVVRATLSGASATTILSGAAALQTPMGVTLDAGSGRLYIADAGKQDVRIASTSGTNLTPVATGIGATHQVLADRHLGKLFVALPDVGLLKTADTDGGNVQTILGSVTVGGMALADHPLNLLRNDGHDSLDATLLVSAFDATSANGATVTVNANGTYTYDPTGAPILQMLDDGESLVDTFSYTLSDGTLSDIAVVGITVNGSNDPDPTVSIGAPSAGVTSAGPVSFEVLYENANAITLSPGDVSLVTTGSATGTIAVDGSGLLSRTITISDVAGDGTIAIQLAGGTAADIEGDLAPAAGPGASFAVDNTAPTVSISAPSVPATTSGPVTYNISYSGADHIDLTPDDIVLHTSGTATATIGVSGGNTPTPVVMLSGVAGDGMLSLSVAGGVATDDAGNTDPGAGPSATFDADNTPPGLAIGPPSTTITQNGPVSYAVSYTDADTVNLTAGDVTLNTTGSATGIVSVLDGATNSPTVTISGIAGEGAISISIASGTASDNLGNLATAAGPGQEFEVDSSPPTVSIGSPSATLTRSGPISFILTVSDADTINVTPADITLNATGTASGVVSVAGGTTKFPIVTISFTTGDGYLGISVAGGVATDVLGQASQPEGPSGQFRVVNYAPIMFIEMPSTGLTRGGPVDFPIAYYGATSITLSAANVSVHATGTAIGSVSVSGTGNEYRTVTLDQIAGDGTLGISIVPGTASNATGNLEPFGAGPGDDVIIDNTPPVLTATQANPSAALPNQTVLLELQFDSVLGADPEVRVNGHPAYVVSSAGVHTFAYTIRESDPVGPATIEVVAFDLAGNSASFVDSGSLTVISIDESLPLTGGALAVLLGVLGAAVHSRRKR